MTLPLFDSNFVTPKGFDLSVFKPELITKQVKIQTYAGDRKIRLSSNFLPLVGFTPGTRTKIEELGVNQGIKISFDVTGKTKIYQRTYKSRKNNPIEAQIDIQNQSVINRSIPEDSEILHFTLKNGSIVIKPLMSGSLLIRNGIKKAATPYSSFVALSSGIDCYCLQASGFTIQSLLEYRPREARDKQDFTETGALNAITNVPVKNLFNEDITKVNWDSVKRTIANDDQVGLLHISLQCDDFSNAKSNTSKRDSINNLDTSVDLVYDALRMIETVQSATILIENVPPFKNSAAADLLRVKLRKWGYYVHEQILDAREFGGLTSRKRYYLVASVWPGFEMPSSSVENKNASLWKLIESHLPSCRDISNTTTVYKAIESGRSRIITKESSFAPTVMKSQNRMAKDSIFIEAGGKYFMPTESILRELNGFPKELNLDSASETIASEIIGQSIDYTMHHKLILSVKNHIMLNS